jgi:hypothetical protein
MGESSRFILSARVNEADVRDAEGVLAQIGGQTIDAVSATAPPSRDVQ